MFDLTNAANAPFVGGACPGAGSNAKTGMALMNQSLCDELYSRWFGNANLGSSSFSFSSQTLALPERNAARMSVDGPAIGGFGDTDFSGGEWSLVRIAAVPEPSTRLALAVGLLTLLLRGLLATSRRH